MTLKTRIQGATLLRCTLGDPQTVKQLQLCKSGSHNICTYELSQTLTPQSYFSQGCATSAILYPSLYYMLLLTQKTLKTITHQTWSHSHSYHVFYSGSILLHQALIFMQDNVFVM